MEHLLLGSVVAVGINSDDERKHICESGKNKRSVTRQVKLVRTKGSGLRVLGRDSEWRVAGGVHHEDVGAITQEHLVKVETISRVSKEKQSLAADVLLVGDCAGSRQGLEEDREREGSASAIVNMNLRILWGFTLLF